MVHLKWKKSLTRSSQSFHHYSLVGAFEFTLVVSLPLDQTKGVSLEFDQKEGKFIKPQG